MATNIHKDQFRDAAKMVPDLKPCPFCGATKDDSEIIEPTEDCVEPSLALHTWNHGEGHATYLVQCARCDAQGPTSYQSEHAIHLWNTRRPLPTTNHKQISSKLVVDELPLEDEIETLWEHSEHIDSLTGHMAFKALVKSLRYLRDEIQKLKEAK